ncbi:MAG: DUF732 domain-containing protein [Mycobacterium sp.]
MTRRSLTLSAALTLSIALSVPAHADDASYLQKLNASGVPIPVSDDVRLSTGHYICGQIRVHTPGYDIRRLLADTFLFSPEAAQAELDAAQSELCPDTLGFWLPEGQA